MKVWTLSGRHYDEDSTYGNGEYELIGIYATEVLAQKAWADYQNMIAHHKNENDLYLKASLRWNASLYEFEARNPKPKDRLTHDYIDWHQNRTEWIKQNPQPSMPKAPPYNDLEILEETVIDV